MKKKSSNIEMNPHLELLSTLKKVSAPEHLYEGVMTKIQQKNNDNFVNPIWYKTIAAVFTLIISTQIVLFLEENKNYEKKNIEKIIALNKNQLYND